MFVLFFFYSEKKCVKFDDDVNDTKIYLCIYNIIFGWASIFLILTHSFTAFSPLHVFSQFVKVRKMCRMKYE